MGTTLTFASMAITIAILRRSMHRRSVSLAVLAMTHFPYPIAHTFNIKDLSVAALCHLTRITITETSKCLEEMGHQKETGVVGDDGYEIVNVTKTWNERYRMELASWDFGGDGEW